MLWSCLPLCPVNIIPLAAEGLHTDELVTASLAGAVASLGTLRLWFDSHKVIPVNQKSIVSHERYGLDHIVSCCRWKQVAVDKSKLDSASLNR